MNYVTFLGPISHYLLPKYFASADLFVSPSIVADDGDREGLPNTYCESIASGVPVLTTDLPGNFDIITPGFTGYTVSQKDSQAIAGVLRGKLLMENRFERKDKLHAYIVESFSWNGIASSYIMLYTTTITGK